MLIALVTLALNCCVALGLTVAVDGPTLIPTTAAKPDILRMRLLLSSAMNKLPWRSPVIPLEKPTRRSSSALVAGPPSPLKPKAPFPATVRIIPVLASTSRIRLL